MDWEITMRRTTLATAVALGCAGMGAAPAFAQEQSQASQGVEEVVVTGSYLERPADRPQPVSVIDTTDINLEQRSSTAEIMRDIPQIVDTNWTAGFLAPTNSIDLRGLGARATLVLLNGKRQTIDGIGGGAVDVNNLVPSIMIQRVEMLTDGASALYGSDAVAGVVNFLTRDNFEGEELKAETQWVASQGLPAHTVGGIFGSQSDDGGIVAGFEYATSDSFNTTDRYSEDRLRIGLQSSFANPGSFSPSTGGPPIADPLCGSDQIGGGLAAGYINPGVAQCQLQLSLGRGIIPETERLTALTRITHDFGPAVTSHVELGFARARTKHDYGYGVPILFPLPIVPGRNPGVAAAGFDTSIDYGVWTRAASPAFEDPIPMKTRQDTVRVAADLSGPISTNWDWTLSATYSENDTRTEDSDTIRSRYNEAVQGYGGPNCAYSYTDPTEAANGFPHAGAGSCLYWNPFASRMLAQPGDPTYNDPSLQQWFAAGRVTDGNARLTTFQALVTGELGELAGGTTGLAVGVQHRAQTFGIAYDDISHDGGFAFNTQVLSDFAGELGSDSLFAELDLYPTQTLEIQLAARHERYDRFDSTDPKIGFLWTPTEKVFFRATAGTSFREPGARQAFGVGPGNVSRLPIGGEIIQANGISVGNPNLEPETSKNWTVGFTYDVTDNFTVDMTYWSVQFDNLIVQEDADVVLRNDIADGYLNDPRIQTFPNANTEVCEVTGRWDPAKAADGSYVNPLPPGCATAFDIQLFRMGYVNQDYQKTNGVDFNFTYSFAAGSNEYALGLNGTWTPTYDLTSEGTLYDGAGSYNFTNFGSSNADLRANLRFSWTHGNHFARATYRHISALGNDDLELRPRTESKPFDVLDLVYRYGLPNGTSDVSVAVLNALDAEDPIIDNSLNTSSGLFDARGRMYRVGLNWGF